MIQSVVIMVSRGILAHQTRDGDRTREAGAGARHRLVFVDRLVVTLIRLRHDLPHSVLALLSGVDRSSYRSTTQRRTKRG